MEMEGIATEPERYTEMPGAVKPTQKTKTEEEAEPNPYSKLQSPDEDVYAEACDVGALAKTKTDNQPEGNARLYRAMCAFLAVMCLILLLVVIILCVRIQAGATDSSNRSLPSNCNISQRLTVLNASEPISCRCPQCTDGWVDNGEWCYFLSTFRLSWDKSQKNCRAKGGSLAVISSLEIQALLTKVGELQYWIGLSGNKGKWTWINNTVLTESYWADDPSSGNCAFLQAGNQALTQKNWVKGSCEAYTYFICQIRAGQHLSSL